MFLDFLKRKIIIIIFHRGRIRLLHLRRGRFQRHRRCRFGWRYASAGPEPDKRLNREIGRHEETRREDLFPGRILAPLRAVQKRQGPGRLWGLPRVSEALRQGGKRHHDGSWIDAHDVGTRWDMIFWIFFFNVKMRFPYLCLWGKVW